MCVCVCICGLCVCVVYSWFEFPGTVTMRERRLTSLEGMKIYEKMHTLFLQVSFMLRCCVFSGRAQIVRLECCDSPTRKTLWILVHKRMLCFEQSRRGCRDRG